MSCLSLAFGRTGGFFHPPVSDVRSFIDICLSVDVPVPMSWFVRFFLSSLTCSLVDEAVSVSDSSLLIWLSAGASNLSSLPLVFPSDVDLPCLSLLNVGLVVCYTTDWSMLLLCWFVIIVVVIVIVVGPPLGAWGRRTHPQRGREAAPPM